MKFHLNKINKKIIIFLLLLTNTISLITLPIIIVENNKYYNKNISINELKQYLFSYYNNCNLLYHSTLRAIGNKLGCHEFKELVYINDINYVSKKNNLYFFDINIKYNSFDDKFPDTNVTFKININKDNFLINYLNIEDSWELKGFLDPNTSGVDIELINYLETNNNENLILLYNSYFNKINPTFNPTLSHANTGMVFLNYINSNKNYINCLFNISWTEGSATLYNFKFNCIYDVSKKTYVIIGLVKL